MKYSFFPHNRAPCTPEIPNKKQKKRRIKNHRHCLCRYFILRTLRLYLASTNISIIVLITIFLSIQLQYTIRILLLSISIAATDGIGCYVCTSMNGDNPYCDDPFNTTFPGIFLFYIYFSNKSTIFLHAKKEMWRNFIEDGQSNNAARFFQVCVNSPKFIYFSHV